MNRNVTLGSWRPDAPVFQPEQGDTLHLHQCNNMIRRSRRWQPVLVASGSTSNESLPGIEQPVRTRSFDMSDGSREVIEETSAGHLYRLRDGRWSKLTTMATDTHWAIEQYGDTIYATTANQSLKKWTPGDAGFSSSGITEPPVGAQVIARVRYFLVVANITNHGVMNGSPLPSTIRWSAQGDPNDFTNGTSFADSQVLPNADELGEIRGILVFEDSFVVCERGITRMIFGGGAYAFHFDTPIARNAGAVAFNTSFALERMMYMCSRNGFVAVDLAGNVSHIGMGLVDNTFFQLWDPQKAHFGDTFYDPETHAIYWIFSRGTNYPNTSFIYSHETHSWSCSDGSYQTRITSTSAPLTWADVERIFGADIDTVGRSVITFQDPRLAGSFDTVNAFGPARKLAPANSIPDCELTTKMFQLGRQRSFIENLWPISDGQPAISVASFEEQDLRLGTAPDFKPFDPLRQTGRTPGVRSGRYFQIKVAFTRNEPMTYLSGLQIEWQRDGEL